MKWEILTAKIGKYFIKREKSFVVGLTPEAIAINSFFFPHI